MQDQAVEKAPKASRPRGSVGYFSSNQNAETYENHPKDVYSSRAWNSRIVKVSAGSERELRPSCAFSKPRDAYLLATPAYLVG